MGSTFLYEDGRPSFSLLQNYGSATPPLLYYAFDLLVLAGEKVLSRLEHRVAQQILGVDAFSASTGRVRIR